VHALVTGLEGRELLEAAGGAVDQVRMWRSVIEAAPG
jgi:hypothetical protein